MWPDWSKCLEQKMKDSRIVVMGHYNLSNLPALTCNWHRWRDGRQPGSAARTGRWGETGCTWHVVQIWNILAAFHGVGVPRVEWRKWGLSECSRWGAAAICVAPLGLQFRPERGRPLLCYRTNHKSVQYIGHSIVEAKGKFSVKFQPTRTHWTLVYFLQKSRGVVPS